MTIYYLFVIIYYAKSSSVSEPSINVPQLDNINTPFVSKFNTNDLSYISTLNVPRLPISDTGEFEPFKASYHNNNCKVDYLTSSLEKTLQNIEGYYVISMDNLKQPHLLFDFFDVSDDSLQQSLNMVQINLFEPLNKGKFSIIHNRKIFSQSNDVYTTSNLHRHKQYSNNNKIYFVIFHIKNTLTKVGSHYILTSKIDLFRSYEVTKHLIFPHFKNVCSKHQSSSEDCSISPQQFMIFWLTTSLRYKYIKRSDIRIQNFDNNHDWLGRTITITLRKLKVDSIENNKINLTAYKYFNFDNVDILENDNLVNININFNVELKSNDSHIKIDMKLKTQYYSVIPNNGKHLFRNGNGSTFINVHDKTMGGYKTSKFSKINEVYIEEFLNEFKEIK
eukprot:GAHX01002434.1.p1 GENE.GAHX01002434.1~~GAHX01002434.1.p1  ORF type:complete len:426 (+),score=74.66 GAHX01002434.1:107-1279(+)